MKLLVPQTSHRPLLPGEDDLLIIPLRVLKVPHARELERRCSVRSGRKSDKLEVLEAWILGTQLSADTQK